MSVQFNYTILGHYPHDQQQSMRRFAESLAEGLREAGHAACMVVVPRPRLGRLKPSEQGLGKWLGYVDKYVLYPFALRRLGRESSAPGSPPFVIIPDHSHGPYVPTVGNLPHVVHVHDLLAQRSALGHFPQNPTSKTGKLYQSFIRRGLRQARCFICISEATKRDLLELLPELDPANIHVVHNELNWDYLTSGETIRAKRSDSTFFPSPISPLPSPTAAQPFWLHVGGNQWYKNRIGVLRLFAAYHRQSSGKTKLIMVGKEPTAEMLDFLRSEQLDTCIEFRLGVSNEDLAELYTDAIALLFPSLYEGFGWPPAEAMACGCPVITTDQAPMTEVGGEAAWYIPRMPASVLEQAEWAKAGAQRMHALRSLPLAERTALEEKCIQNAQRFAPGTAMKQYFEIYEDEWNKWHHERNLTPPSFLSSF